MSRVRFFSENCGNPGRIFIVARGWESKAVEEQQAEAGAAKKNTGRALTPAELAKEHERQGLLLSKAYLLQQLEATQHPHRQQMLQATIADLDAKLAGLV